MAVNEKELKKFDIFSGLSSGQINKISNIVKEKKYSTGEIIIKEGEEGLDLFLLFKGSVEVSKSLTLLVGRGDLDIREKSLKQFRAENGPYFGEMSLVNEGAKRTATVKALEKCYVGIVNRTDLLNLCDQDNGLGYRLMLNIAATITEHLKKANQDIMKLTTAFSFALQG